MMMRALIIAAALMLPTVASAQVAQEGQWPSALAWNMISGGVSTKGFTRQGKMDIEEHVCILEQMQALPSFKYNIRE